MQQWLDQDTLDENEVINILSLVISDRPLKCTHAFRKVRYPLLISIFGPIGWKVIQPRLSSRDKKTKSDRSGDNALSKRC